MEENNSKEINLLQLLTIIFNWLGNLFQSIFKTIGKALKLCYRNRIVVIIILVLAIIFGQYFSRPSARIYRAEAMAMINGSQAQTLKEVMKQVPIVQNAILNFLNTNSVLLNNFNIEKTNMLSTINICEAESKRIDSLAKINYFKQNDQQLNIENNKLLIGEQRKQLFYGELIELQNIKAGVQFRLEGFKAPIILPSNFVVNPIPENGRVKYGVISILIGFVVALLISILIENFKYLISYLKSE